MRSAFYALAVLLAAYLWVDKFLFRGELARLFAEGWARRLRTLVRRLPRQATRPPSELTTPAMPEHGELVPRKAYFPSSTAPAGASDPKAVSKAAGDVTFVVPPASEVEPEVLEWRAPEYSHTEPPEHPASPVPPATTTLNPPRTPPLWDDEGFSTGRFIPHDDESGEGEWLVEYDPEKIQREVMAALEQFEQQTVEQFIQDDPPADHEQYEVEHFDAAAYK